MSKTLTASLILIKVNSYIRSRLYRFSGNLSRKFFKIINALSLEFLGPRGMDKLIHSGRDVTISNDGATLIGLLDIVHPAAKTLVDIARSQDN